MPDRPPRLERVFRSYEPPLWFVTFNTHRRRTLLANKAAQASFTRFLSTPICRGIGVGRYVIMPDHIHLFVRGNLDFSLVQWVRILKGSLSKEILVPLPHWQHGFFDHLIRHSESYAQKREYVRLNPVRAGLVSNCDEWPWQGEIVRLEA